MRNLDATLASAAATLEQTITAEREAITRHGTDIGRIAAEPAWQQLGDIVARLIKASDDQKQDA